MKLISKTILRRTTSEPVCDEKCLSSSSQNNSSNDTMTVDLADMDALPALRLLKNTPSLHQNVQSAIVNSESCVWYGHIKIDFHALVEVFQCLGELRRLQHVTVDLSHLQVPVAAFTALLRGAQSLRELHLMNLHLVGPREALELALQAHTNLARVKIVRCKGRALQALMTNLPNLKKLELRHTSIGVVADSSRDDNPWTVLGRSTKLRSLTVQEVPDLKTEHVLTFVDALSYQQQEEGSSLQELHITSANVDGQLCGPALADFLVVHPTCSIRTLTLKFGSTWKTTGHTVSNILRHNHSITSLCVELANNREVTNHGMEVLQALQSNVVLKRLKLCLDQDQQLDGPLEKRFLQAMECLLQQHNRVLQSLVVLDENREKCILPSTIRHLLDLNTSQLPKLLGSSTRNEFLGAMIESKDNLDAVFYALTNQPNLLLNLSVRSQALLEQTNATDSEEEEDPTSNWGKSSKPRRHSAQSAKKRLMSFFK